MFALMLQSNSLIQRDTLNVSCVKFSNIITTTSVKF